MTILIGLTIILVLMCSESAADWPMIVSNKLGYASMMALCLVAAPGVAVLPANYRRWVADRGSRIRPVESSHKPLMACMAVWCLASLTMATVLQWHRVVRVTWQIDRVFILDELLILAPSLLSLGLTWLVGADADSSDEGENRGLGLRWRYVVTRCRFHLLILLIPVFGLVIIRDSWPALHVVPPVVRNLIILAMVLALLAFMPQFITLIWRNRPVTTGEGREKMLNLCAAHCMAVRDVRVWDTGGQVVNAVVAGMLPGFRLLMISDRLLSGYPEHELCAILRHEAGHIRLRHLPIRIGFILLPALSLAAIELDPQPSLQIYLHQFFAMGGWPLDHRMILGLLFLIYLVAITAWLSRNMEIEADLYAIGACAREGQLPPAVTRGLAVAMTDALIRFAYHYPEQVNRSTVTHPSLMCRIDMIRVAHENRRVASRFRQRFAIGQFLIVTIIVTVTATLLLA